MNDIREANQKIVQMHGELIRLLEIIVQLMDKNLQTEQEKRELCQMVRNFEICSGQLSILKDMLLLKVMSEEIIEN